MQAVILAGGYGTRISEESLVKPKPLVTIGDKPILWHIMKLYSHYGIDDFIVCCGYKGFLIKEYFLRYYERSSDIEVNLAENSVHFIQRKAEPWRIKLIDTGERTMTGGRLKRIKDLIEDDVFMMTYGDGLADIDIASLRKEHLRAGKLATLTAIRPASRFGTLRINEHNIASHFAEKPEEPDRWVNGGFFVLNKKVIDLIEGDDSVWEHNPLTELTRIGELNCYIHKGFWQSMDTMRDKMLLEDLWKTGSPPWKLWKS